MKISIENLTLTAGKLPPDADKSLHGYIAAKCGLKAADILSYKILKRSLDARKKPDLKLIYNIIAEVPDGARSAFPLTPAPEKVSLSPEESIPSCKNSLSHPIVIGSGPAGLFCAYALSLAGCRPIVLERGKDVEERKKSIETFLAERTLDPESNFLYGEGGAGTWSDGKLFTRVKDPRIAFVLDTFVRMGADESIHYFSHPHIGSDKLGMVISNLRKEILRLGGEFRFSCCVKKLFVENNVCKGVILTTGEKLEAPAVVAACGHSARNFLWELSLSGVKCSLKGFQIGCRIEHPQKYINLLQYGSEAAPGPVGSAEYQFISKPSPDGTLHGVTSFCMCPGGEIIPATAEEGFLSTNGMSNFARDGQYANSALVTTLPENAFSSVQGAFSFLRDLEKKVYKAGNGDYSCPAQSAVNFMRKEPGASYSLHSSYALGVVPFSVDRLLPKGPAESIRRALRYFEKIAPGFASRGTIVGLETHVSSPLRFERNPLTEYCTFTNFYMAGEGAGMAGGITSSAIDGIRMAEAMLRNPL